MDDSTLLPPELALLLTIRFSASIPDMPIEIPSPTSTTAAGLKQLIRQNLPQQLRNHRLRLIHAGKAIEDTVPLASALKLASPSPTPPPPPTPWGDTGDEKGKWKGKEVIRDPPGVDTRTRIYIHCSIGDIVLSAEDLATEARQAHITLSSSEQQQRGHEDILGDHTAGRKPGPSWSSAGGAQGDVLQGSSTGGDAAAASSSTTTTPAPRGFDRLLSAGFTVTEVSALRSQFLALQSLSRTPDEMPSGAELRMLEDQWMDEGSSGMGGGGGGVGDSTGFGGGGAGAGVTDDGGVSAALDDMLWGCVMGFFWPVGCALWLLREDGVWSFRKGLAVFVGVAVNLGFGAVRVLN